MLLTLFHQLDGATHTLAFDRRFLSQIAFAVCAMAIVITIGKCQNLFSFVETIKKSELIIVTECLIFICLFHLRTVRFLFRKVLNFVIC